MSVGPVYNLLLTRYDDSNNTGFQGVSMDKNLQQ